MAHLQRLLELIRLHQAIDQKHRRVKCRFPIIKGVGALQLVETGSALIVDVAAIDIGSFVRRVSGLHVVIRAVVIEQIVERAARPFSRASHGQKDDRNRAQLFRRLGRQSCRIGSSRWSRMC